MVGKSPNKWSEPTGAAAACSAVPGRVRRAAMDPSLIAPCGMNCAVCSHYLSFRNNLPLGKCAGCRPRNKQCAFLKKKCEDNLKLLNGEITFCHECNCYPCRRLRRLDERYRNQYGMSMIENLDFIQANGLGAFVRQQINKYRCAKCGELKSTHNNKCFQCDKIESLK